MPKFKDYYQVLGIPPRSHARVIEESYWEQAHELHRQPTRKAARRLSVINEAYEVLGSPHRRDVYDRLYADKLAGEQPPPRPGLLNLLFNLVGKAFRPD